MPNPYAPPQTPPDPFAGADGADLFVEMQPTMAVRAAGVASILTGVACLFVAVQFVIGAIRQNAIVLAIEAACVAFGVGFFAVAWGVGGARAWGAIGGIALSVLTGAALAVVFFASGALSTVMAGTAALVTLVLLATSLGDARKMARARAAMLRARDL